jgi:hypothetical protein
MTDNPHQTWDPRSPAVPSDQVAAFRRINDHYFRADLVAAIEPNFRLDHDPRPTCCTGPEFTSVPAPYEPCSPEVALPSCRCGFVDLAVD